MFINYKRTVDFSKDIINAGVNQDGLITCAQKVTTGAPVADANKYIASAIVQNVVTGTIYINNGTSALPVWGTLVTDYLPDLIGIYSTNQPQVLTGAGAAQVSCYHTLFESTGTGQAISLADGTQAGQLKKISYTAENAGGDSGVITPDNPDGFNFVALDTVGSYVQFIWTGSEWAIIEYVGAIIA